MKNLDDSQGARRPAVAAAALLALGALAGPALAQDAAADPWKVDIYYENDTRFRGKDNTGSTVGLSKFRNTLQVEADKRLGGGWQFRGILRGTFDGVYRLNDDEYGDKAGGPIELDSQLGVLDGTGFPFTPTSAHGDGIIGTRIPVGVFGFNSTDPNAPGYNPNAGLRVLGDRWHGVEGGVAFAVPVRPCDTDNRGCEDFGGYGDLDRSELEFPEFNKKLDFIREAYVRNTFKLDDGSDLFLKIGKQQVVWGRTDLFRVLDVINPVDYSRNNIYDELQDIRIPMWIAQAEWRMGGSKSLQERNLQVVWNFDKFRPNNLGQCGSPNVILDAGCFFRGMINLWDNGGTVANFANIAPGAFLTTDFPAGSIGIRDVKLPGWSLKNTQLGIKFEGVTGDGLSFSLNALTYRSQLPSIRGAKGATNPFTGEYRPDGGWPYLIAFDMHFPRVNLVGGSMDFEWEKANAAVRIEAAYTSGEEFANSLKPQLFSENDVFRSVIGIDRPTFIPWINPNRTTLFSAQLFYQHIFDHEKRRAEFGDVGMPDWKDNAIATLLIKAFLAGDRISPQLITAYDFKARALVTSPQIDWVVNDKLKLTFGGNFKTRDNDNRWKFDDARGTNPFPPFTAPFGDGDPLTAFSRGITGLEPLGRFRAGPIGTAWKENEIYFTARYQF